MALAPDAPGPEAEPEAAVDWKAPDGCPRGHTVQERLLRLAPSTDRDVHGRARVVEVDEGFELRLEVQQGAQTSERVVRDRSCDALAELVALTLAIARDPSAIHRVAELDAAPTPETSSEPPAEDPPGPPGPPGPGPGPAVTELPPPEVADVGVSDRPPTSARSCAARHWPAPVRQRLPCVSGAVLAGVVVGPLRRPGALVGGELAVMWPSVVVRAGAHHVFAHASEPIVGGGFVSVRGVIATANLGLRVALGRRFEVSPSVGVDAGGLRARGRGFADQRSRLVPFVASNIAGDAAVVFGRFAFGARAALVVPWTRIIYESDQEIIVSSTASLGVRALGWAAMRW